jgi:hypothetical protein
MKSSFPYIVGGCVILILIGLLMSNQQKQPQSSTTPLSANPSTDSATTKDPQDIVPGLYKNQIQNVATKEGFTITASAVENNTDSAGKVVGDHLELALKNNAGKDIADFEIYYTITDLTANKKEGYYKKLTGYVLKSGDTQSIHFDNKQGTGHFSANKNSIYYTSNNKLVFDVMVSTPGYKTQSVQVTKSAGGAEVKD